MRRHLGRADTLDIHIYTQFDKPNRTSSEVNMKKNSSICDFRHRSLQCEEKICDFQTVSH